MKLARLSCIALTAIALGGASSTPVPVDDPGEPPQEAGEQVGFADDGRERMTVDAMIGGKGPYQFLIDTGAERTVISAELARALDLGEGRAARLHSMSGVTQVSTVVIPELQVSKKPVRDIHAPALKRAHIGAAGMLGVDSLQSQRVTFDFERQTMTIVPSKAPQPRRDSETIVVTARSRLGRLVLVDARLDGQKLKVVLDTGSEVTVGNGALRKKLIARKRLGATVPIELISVTGGKTAADYTRVKQMRIGGVLINDLPVAFADVHPFRQLGMDDEPALLLGMDALRLFDRVSVDFATRKVRFTHPDISGLGSPARMALASSSPAG